MRAGANMLVGAVLMATGTWLSNLAPSGLRYRRALGALGWGVPAGLAMLLSGLPLLPAIWVGVAAVFGAMVPPTPAGRLGRVNGHVLGEGCELFLEGQLRLLPVGLVFWACNLYWPKAVEAAAFILPGYLFGALLHPCISFRGAGTPNDLGAVLFAAATGALLAVTPLLPDHPEWPPLPEAVSTLAPILAP